MNDVEFYLEDLRSKFDKIDPQDYVLAYSGGRDSELLRVIIKDYLKLPIKIVSINTRMEFGEIHERMKKNADVILLPKKTIYDVKEEYGVPCFSKIQDEFIYRYQNGSRTKNTMQYVTGVREDGQKTLFKLSKKARVPLLSGDLHKISNKCCDWLKKKPIKEYLKEHKQKEILGVRGSESHLRKSKYTSCFTKDGKFTPIHDLGDALFEKLEKYFDIEVPKIYDHLPQSGCIGCPYARKPMMELELCENKNKAKYIYNCFVKSYEVTKKLGG